MVRSNDVVVHHDRAHAVAFAAPHQQAFFKQTWPANNELDPTLVVFRVQRIGLATRNINSSDVEEVLIS